MNAVWSTLFTLRKALFQELQNAFYRLRKKLELWKERQEKGRNGRYAWKLHYNELLKSTQLTCSYLEIYNEKLYDLLATKDGTDLPIRQDRSHNILIPNLTETEFATTKQFEDLYQQGCKNRTTAETKLNKSSSRSHAIIMFKVLAPFFFFLFPTVPLTPSCTSVLPSTHMNLELINTFRYCNGN